jgi:DNA-binding transcriptional ArsR family regulator
MIRRQVGPKRAEILDLLLREFGGQEVTLGRLAGALGVHPRSKGFTNNVSTLSGLGLVVRRPGHVRASDLCYVP